MADTESSHRLLAAWRQGDDAARDQLVALLHPALSQIAAAQLRGEQNASLSTGDLVNDAVLRMVRQGNIGINDRAHFLALASRLMRNILIDHARAKRAGKRRHFKVELTTRVEGEQRHDLIALEDALKRLGTYDMKLAELVEMRYFGGMTLADIAAVYGVSEATVKRRWFAARAWLADALINPAFGD
ncbi:ECF-type sigma factor [Sphingomonas flavalba]|uniref:ECF-type sigma factor n=1 Tax=Sphingomonas flavalba TaxID=2559804 RepID=UPI001EF0EB86|nr:ECF-type sigma factor [Sphingomonas flavalba]